MRGRVWNFQKWGRGLPKMGGGGGGGLNPSKNYGLVPGEFEILELLFSAKPESQVSRKNQNSFGNFMALLSPT